MHSQDSGVHSVYSKTDKSTEVQTNFLNVFDTADQFVTIQLKSSYKGDHLTKTPSTVGLSIFSVSNRPLYTNEPLVIVADGVSYRVGDLFDTTYKGEVNNGAESFFIVNTSLRFGVNIPVPQTAKVRGGHSLNGKTMEWLAIGIKTDQFLKFANATKLELQIKNSTFTLNARHLEVIHNFSKEITAP